MNSAALGQVLVFASLVLTAVVAGLAIVGAARGDGRQVRAAGFGMRALAWLGAASSLVLLHAIITHDFSIQYVAHYSDSTLPLLYLITTFWGGEKGALAFWVLSLSVLGGVLAWTRRKDPSSYTGWLLATTALALLFFDILMVFASNPFETFLASGGPADGSGLNPLLQNPLMAVHPPPQLLGFIAYTIPFAYAMAAMASGKLDGSWVVDARRWSLFAWVMLTAGLVVGELWSYLELGWGGYWGWDPVENAALLPWLTGTAMLHTFSVEYRTGLLRRWNVFLAFLTFFLTIFATFLTRSQLIQSLHSFTGSVLTPFFLWYQVVLIVAAAGLILYRWKDLKPAGRIESYLSREALVVAAVLLLLMAVFVVVWGTLLPKFSESPAVLAVVDRALAAIASLTGQVHVPLTGAVNVGPEWFNKAVGPIGIAVLALTALGPVFVLRQAPGEVARGTAWRTLAVGAGLAVVIAAALVLARGAGLATASGMPFVSACSLYLRSLSWAGVYGLLAVTFAMQVLGVASLDWVRSVRARRSAKGESVRAAAGVLFRENPRRYGGHLVHIGVALTFLGYAGAAGKLVKKDAVLAPMEETTLGGRALRFLGTKDRWEPAGGYAALEAFFLVYPKGRPIDAGAVDSVRAALPDASSVEAGEPPFVAVRFSSEEAARGFLVTTSARATLAPSLALSGVDRGRREVRLVPRRPEVLRVLPESFKRLAQAASVVTDGAGKDRLTLRVGGRGDLTMTVTAADDAAFDAMLAGWQARDESPILAARAIGNQPTVVEVVPAGAGVLMSPEVRHYLKSENPTTEVEIEPGLLSDLYLAATPAQGAGEVNLTAMDHPMMSSLWLGAVIALLAGAALIAPVRRRREPVRKDEPVVAAVTRPAGPPGSGGAS